MSPGSVLVSERLPGVVAGVYKPRIRCYDVKQLSMKFERCLDAESEP